MQTSAMAYGGMVAAPHHLASQAGLRALNDGGNAIEAMVAAAAMIAVAYPHMNSLGGDNFWLIHQPGGTVRAIDACGAAAGLAGQDFYAQHGHSHIPHRGPLAALTVAGAVSGWDLALRLSRSLGGTLPLDRLLEDAIHHAEHGVAVTRNLARVLLEKNDELAGLDGFGSVFMPDGVPLSASGCLQQPRVAETLRTLARNGLDDFYRGALARAIADDLVRVGSPLRRDDLARHHAREVSPLALDLGGHRVFNMPPPTQGIASLLLLGINDRLNIRTVDTAEFMHGLIEATKQSFLIRDSLVTDPRYMTADPQALLGNASLDRMAAACDPERAAPWPHQPAAGDTVWLGASDSSGLTVSFIQSIYWEFGSGVILDSTGIQWQNRGSSFSLEPTHHNALAPGRKPFHTIQPPLAHLADGRIMAYGTMGGDGQPQTQAIVFNRHVGHGQDLQKSISAPRWLLGRTWGDATASLRIEA
ncbi:MAG: gamma-glutamyltransferase, partial [Rhodobacteraceae bacterium]|nr:gamma-glutamyltransferase [Paracoccaceae bacterium]